MSNLEYHTLTVEIRRQTDLAILVFDGEKEFWLPKSQIEDQVTLSTGVEITIPHWLAEERNLI